ncbi:hypothetical protein ACFE04_031145 [Oxalis oulophora]
MESSSAVTTVSECEQWTVESRVFQIYILFASIPPTSQSLMLELQRENHIEYLTRGLKQLAPSFCILDAKYMKHIDSGLLYYFQPYQTQGILIQRSHLVGIIMRRNDLARSCQLYALAPAYEAVTKSYEDGPSGNTSKPDADEVDSREVNLPSVNVLFDGSELYPLFVVANGIVSGYVILSLPLSIINIVRSRAQISRVLLLVLDTVMLAFLTAAASAAAAIVYLAHKGNKRTNWFATCQQLNSFCERISGSLIGSFGAIFIFILLILLSGLALSRR